jgi:hypothetical protein
MDRRRRGLLAVLGAVVGAGCFSLPLGDDGGGPRRYYDWIPDYRALPVAVRFDDRSRLRALGRTDWAVSDDSPLAAADPDWRLALTSPLQTHRTTVLAGAFDSDRDAPGGGYRANGSHAGYDLFDRQRTLGREAVALAGDYAVAVDHVGRDGPSPRAVVDTGRGEREGLLDRHEEFARAFEWVGTPAVVEGRLRAVPTDARNPRLATLRSHAVDGDRTTVTWTVVFARGDEDRRASEEAVLRRALPEDATERGRDGPLTVFDLDRPTDEAGPAAFERTPD